MMALSNIDTKKTQACLEYFAKVCKQAAKNMFQSGKKALKFIKILFACEFVIFVL